MTPWPDNIVFDALKQTFIHKHRVNLCHVQNLEFVSETLDVRNQSIRLNHLRQFVIAISLSAVKPIDYPSSFSSPNLKPTPIRSETLQSSTNKVGFTCIFVGIYQRIYPPLFKYEVQLIIYYLQIISIEPSLSLANNYGPTRGP